MRNAELLKKEDGIWLSVKTRNGNWALINLTNLGYRLGPVTGDALLQWAEENLGGDEGE